MNTTISSYIVRAVVNALDQEEGTDKIDVILEKTGIPRNELTNPDYRITPQLAGLLWKNINPKKYGDYFGIKIALNMNLLQMGLPGIFFVHSFSIKEALKKHVMYNNLVSSYSRITLSKSDTLANERILFKHPEQHPVPLYVMQSLIIPYTIAISKISDGKCYPEKVWFNFPHPGEHIELFTKVLKCEIIFDEGFTAIEYRSEQLDYKLINRDHNIVEHIEILAEKKLKKLANKETLSELISDMIKEKMYHSNIVLRANELAEIFHISTRTLQRKLKEESTSYSIILDEVRKKEAMLLLEKDELNINEISWFLGYAETSSFIQQFKKWTTMSPSVYKKKAHKTELN